VPTTDVAILEAALDQFTSTGVTRTSTDDIAKRAGVNRATVYRRFGTREQLLSAAYLHEAGRVLETLTARIPDVPAPGSEAADGFDAAAHVVTLFTEGVAVMRDNALLRRLLEVDRELVMVGMTEGAADVLAFAADVLGQRVRELHDVRGTTPPADPHALGVTVARLIQSLVLTPGGSPDLGSAQAARSYARSVIAPLLLGH